MVVFVPLLPLSGYAHVPPKPSDHTDSHKINNFSLGPQEILAVEEQASQMKAGLEHLGAGDIQRMFVLPRKESVSSESSESEGMVRVAFLDTAKKCFVYDSMTKEMVICDEEDTVLVRDSEEVLASSLSSYAPVDSSFIPVGALQTAGLRDFICTYETEIKIGAGVLAIAGTLIIAKAFAITGGAIAVTGALLGGATGIALVNAGIQETYLGLGTGAGALAIAGGVTQFTGAKVGALVSAISLPTTLALLGAVAVTGSAKGIIAFSLCPTRG